MEKGSKEGKREKFGSRLGFILVSAGCAIGLGNVWKFPYVMGENGGAGFIAIYLIFLLILGLPLMTMEFSVGRGAQQSVATGFKYLQKEGSKFHLFGYIGMAGNYLLMMFYTTVAGWMIHYFYKMATGELVGMSAEQIGANFGQMLESPATLTLWMVIAVVLAFGICSLGMKNGVEKITKIMMSALLVLMVVMVVRSVTLPGAKAGVDFYLKPDLSKMMEIGIGNVIFAAMGQAFFTLSIGMGSMMVFGSYMDKKRSLTGEAATITILDTAVALMAGLIIIPACFAYGIQPNSGPGLIFITLPNVFNSMPAGRLWGTAFFLFLSFAALSTVVAVFENLISFHMDLWNSSRKKAVIVNLILVITLSMPCILGFNVLSNFHPFGPESVVLDLEDFIISQNILPLGSLVFLFFCTNKNGWGWMNFIEEVNAGKGLRFPSKLKGYFLFGVPILIVSVYIKGYWDFFVKQGMNPYMGLIIAFAALAFLVYICFYSRKKHVER